MRTIKRGDRGVEVKHWQRFLHDQGIDPKGEDGIFGPGCEGATKQFQQAHGLDADGRVGPMTQAAAVKLGFSPPVSPPASAGEAPRTAAGGIDYSHKEPVPAGINAGLKAASNATMMEIFGKPGPMSVDCSGVTSARVKRNAVTQSVGPFKVTGLKPAVEVLARVFAKVQAGQPDLYAQLGTAGMLCCRAVRGSTTNFSNHSWGTAIDLTVNGKLDEVKDGKAQIGLAKLAPLFHAERFYWGAGFSREDAMHFEASDALVREWAASGVI